MFVYDHKARQRVPVLLQRTIQALLQGGAGRGTIQRPVLVVSDNMHVHQTDIIYIYTSHNIFNTMISIYVIYVTYINYANIYIHN